MRNIKLLAVLAILVLIVSGMGLAGGCMKKPAPKPLEPLVDNQGPPGLPAKPATPSPARMVIGYYENPWPGTPDQSGSFPSMKTYYKSMSHVAPFWYKALADGTLESRESKLVYNTARQLGLKVFPLIVNKSESTDEVLGNPAVRTKTITNIVKLISDKQYDGVNIDFELLPARHEKNLSAFMAELYPKLKAANKTVIVSVFPKLDVDESVHAAYNYAELAKNADFVQLMLYDFHWRSSKPGPVAPIDWYEKNIKYAIEQVGGPGKIIAGLGAYGIHWPPSGAGEDIRYADTIVLADKNGVKIQYDEKAQSPYVKFKGNEIWFENDRSTSAKLDVAAKYNIAGIAIWRIGQEQPEIWAVIDQKFPKQQ